MSYDALGPGALDYLPCRYGTSRLLFRGPRRNLDQSFAAFLGGTETYGKFIKAPFPALVERELGVTCVNFGAVNAGIDVYLRDPFVVKASQDAKVTVIQVMGAQNMTNRFYAVHPRRNDRFVKASVLLESIYREVDFAEFHFNRHMLKALIDVSEDRFEAVRAELQQVWVSRMRLLLERLKSKTMLVWFANHAPLPEGPVEKGKLGDDPLFITRKMMEEITPLATSSLEIVASPDAKQNGTDGMVFGQLEHMAAQQMLGPAAHQEAAKAVSKAIEAMM